MHPFSPHAQQLLPQHSTLNALQLWGLLPLRGKYLSFSISPPSLLSANMVSGHRVKYMSPHKFCLLALVDLRLRVQPPLSGLWASVCTLHLAQLPVVQLWPDPEFQIQCLSPSYPLGLFWKGECDWLTETLGWFLLGQVSTQVSVSCGQDVGSCVTNMGPQTHPSAEIVDGIWTALYKGLS